jgi:uncharacterized protein (DUF342 family)
MTADSLNQDNRNDRPPVVEGRFRLKVSNDKQAVYMDGLQPPSGGGSPVKSKQVHDKLKKLDIKYGIRQDKIDEILTALNEGRLPVPEVADVQSNPDCIDCGSVEPMDQEPAPGQKKEVNDHLCIVRGDAPVHGKDATLRWHVEEDQAQGYVALPDELIATYTPPSDATAGKSVFGKELRAQPGRDDTIKPGVGIKQISIDGGIEYRAQWYGTIRIQDDTITVICPLRISDDHMSATMDLARPSSKNQGLEVSHIIGTLQQHNITFGIRENTLSETLATLQSSGQTVNGFVIACGKPVSHGADARINWNLVESDPSGSDYIVRPGTLIVSRHAATPGESGQDIRGDILPATPGKDHVIQAGAHITCENGRDYYAAALGVLSYTKDDKDTIQLDIDPGLEVAGDAMEAWLTLSGNAGDGSPLVSSDVVKSLVACGIKYGIDEAAITNALQSQADEDAESDLKILAARGKAARDGVDAHIVYTQKEHIAGLELGKGRIDFHEHNFLWGFKNGDIIGNIVGAKAAEDGVNVRGEAVKATPANDMQLKLEGAHIDSHNRIIADTDGTLIINGLHLSLAELYVVDGDVGQKTGNIHSVNDIHIKGHVEPGFAIESQKSIIIGKNIEGAKVRAGGNISIKGGIRGLRSEVYTPGEISAGFIENADVFVNGDITITGSIINSKISSNGVISVGSKQSKQSTIIGGRITAHNRIEAFVLGSSACRKTIISVGFTQEGKQQQRDLKQSIADKEAELTHLEQIETHCRLHPKADSNEVIRKVNITRGAIINDINDLNAQLDEVMKQIEQYENGRVVVHKLIYPGVVIKINDHEYEVEQEMGGGTFLLDDDEVVFRPG